MLFGSDCGPGQVIGGLLRIIIIPAGTGRLERGFMGKTFWKTIAVCLASLALGCVVVYLWWQGTAVKWADDGAPSYAEAHLLNKNPWSRPGTKLEKVNNIVIHYVANPGTSALANRNYFNELQKNYRTGGTTKASAHFIVGLSGEVIQCIPMTEVAYANHPRNEDTVSIEVCHPDASGKFADETYQAVVKLAADLCRQYGLTEEAVIRHHDVSGKACPLYYVEHEDAWAEMKEAIGASLRQP